ncbi:MULTISPECIES: polyprenol monophosphomannose synthase [unclassified Pseudoclavibacter]|uniref:polyprenol monophosphomannose synthase n=1 Tax=unclassified Pseudoclavibacter TaxID=2615177 RepID=UPI0013018D52|nr:MULTISPECIES: polyprenol monophosphomannose synthase [unclassified Pseudoclavibacter]KAB1645516.1 polyprenol monophosphomannose synthase [Pseudoclavibacter sp. CFCC 14310]KAB1646025.1 polyprenol monophosphomannose synthase [Pseudoclavibacter sp. CFCC 14310]KAB1658451.1 polyprenol monophosphomannose synthase [Pseudoclavibacter sp. CFCC 11306]
MSAPTGETLVVIPTYNERESLPGVLERLFKTLPEVSVLVVDDGSPDGTGLLADRLRERHPSLSVLHRDQKHGLGPAYIAGFEWGEAHGFRYLVEMDADGSHLPEQLPHLLAAAGENRLVLGSRWVRGGTIVNWPWYRSSLSHAASIYSRLMLGLGQRDVTSGYRVIPVTALRALRLDEAASHGYCFQIDVLRRAVAAGLDVTEVPITFVERENGRSKMDLSIIVEAVLRVTAWGMQRMLPTRR